MLPPPRTGPSLADVLSGPEARRALSRARRGVRLSVALLAAHPLRSILSAAALVMGVAAVTIMVSVVEAAEQRVVERVRALGTNLLTVSAAPAPRVADRARQLATTTVLRPADAEAIARESGRVRAAAATVSRAMVIRAEGRNTTAAVIGTTPEGVRIRNVAPRVGRLFDDLEEHGMRRVALLGPAVARVLFAGGDPVGQQVRLGAVPFEVIAVLQPRGTDVGGTDLDNTVIIPLGTAMRRLFNVPHVQTLLVQAERTEDLDALELEVRAILDQRLTARSGVAVPYVVQNQAVLLRTQRGAARAMNGLILTVAVLSLVVGGAGILAVTLLSVRERTREIGVRRAVGAKRQDVALQFLIEAGLLAAAGGAAGVVIAALVVGVTAVVGSWQLAFSWRAALLGLACSGTIGIIAGSYPAVVAARLQPIRALQPK